MTTTRAKVAIIGGAFDPPHYGHLLVISSILNSGLVDEVRLVPSGQRPDKDYGASASHRIIMTKLLLESCGLADRVAVDQIEIESQGGIVGTYELIEALSVQLQDHDFYFVIGSDLISALSRWRHAEKLRDRVRFLALKRSDSASEHYPAGYQIEFVQQPFITSLSSTAVRKLIAAQRLLVAALPVAVISYISKHQLYFPPHSN